MGWVGGVLTFSGVSDWKIFKGILFFLTPPSGDFKGEKSYEILGWYNRDLVVVQGYGVVGEAVGEISSGE